MRTKPFAITTVALATMLGMVLCAPLVGCSGCSADRGSTVIQKIGDDGSGEKNSVKTSTVKEDGKTDSDVNETQDTAVDTAEAQPTGNSSSSATPQADSNKTDPSKSNEPKGNDSQPAQSKKKWVAEQGHWETDYSQVWVPNMVYTRHPRFWVNHGGTLIGPFDSDDAAYAWIINDGESGGIGGSVVNDSYTTSEDQGQYEQQATGQHWVVDVVGHWE